MSRVKAVVARITPRHVLIVAGVAIVTLVLAVFLRDTVRELVVLPLSRLAWAAGIVVNSVPQAAWLVVLMLAGAYIVVRSLAHGTGAKPEEAIVVEPHTVAPTRLAFWTGRLTNSKRSPYTAERALNEVRALVVECLVHEHRLAAEDVIDLARRDALDVPADVRALLLEDFSKQPNTPNPLQEILGALRALIARLTKRGLVVDPSMTPEFQRKVNVMLSYVEGMNK